ncbi:helix-turn-helix domain-containing protein [Rhodococcus opacus]|uniref:helix-turn-helix domain-containing protein n=1 Tax=Rhodococcus opacus TaxID=37919 RepID=UPI0024B8F308|nr:helix-turn-helix domain-containing protein [Rhodococcus opacus]MDJ0419691.1 helix-turn-helix domain-containing protein [Rhodococcus opacus]
MRREEPAPVPVAAPLRWWRLRPWARNHLMRRSDRIEAAIVLLTAVLVLLLIPVAAAFGTTTHTRLEQQAQALRAAVHQVPAVLLEDTYLAPDTPEYSIRPAGAQNTARARWTTPHGERTAAVPTPAQQTVTLEESNLQLQVDQRREQLAASFTRTQVADFLGVSRQTVSDMAADGRSSGSRTGGSGGSRPGSSPPTGPTRSCPTSTDSHARESSRQGAAAGIPQSQSRNGWRRITTTA